MGNQTRVLHYPPVTAGYAETMAEIYERLANFIKEKAHQFPDAALVAVSHGGPIRILELGLAGKPFTDEIYTEEEVPICGLDIIVSVAGQTIMAKRTELRVL